MSSKETETARDVDNNFKKIGVNISKEERGDLAPDAPLHRTPGDTCLIILSSDWFCFLNAILYRCASKPARCWVIGFLSAELLVCQ